MTFFAFILILLSIAMHSLWHFLSKSSGKPSFAFFGIFSFSILCVVFPIALCSGLLFKVPFDIFKYAIIGGLCGVVCDIGLMYAYKYSDISLAYPMARALPVFFTLITTSMFSWGKTLSAFTWCGIMIIFFGCMIMAFSNSKHHITAAEKTAYFRKALPGILLAAIGTTGYTISDSFGINAMMKFAEGPNKLLAAGTYSCMREISATITLLVLAFITMFVKNDKKTFVSLAKSYHPYVAGVFAAGAYLLVLIAMSQVTNVNFVQAFRQLSLPLSAFLGWYILKEKITRTRWVALIMIMAGLIISVIK